MKPRFLVADDVGGCAREWTGIFPGRSYIVEVTADMADCVDRMRRGAPSLLVVYAGMARAFSLMRLVRRSDDMKDVPLVMVGDASHEELMAKHRQLPTRADRYLLRPLDPELVRGVVADLTGVSAIADEPPPLPDQFEVELEPGSWGEPDGEAGAFEVSSEMLEELELPVLPETPPEPAPTVRTDERPQSPKGQPAKTLLAVESVERPPDSGPQDAYHKVKHELVVYRQKVAELEQDLRLAVQINKEVRRLQEENLHLKSRTREVEESQRTHENFTDLFKRLEHGYRDTIRDLESLVREKDLAVARLASVGESATVQTSSMAEQLKEEQRRAAELKRPYNQLLSMLEDLDHLAVELELADMEDLLSAMEQHEGDPGTNFQFDEETLVVSAEELARKLNARDV
jgi:hypothetical protein